MIKNLPLLALASLVIPLPALADTFTLKDGSTLEAAILSETADSYILEVQITKSIKDERKIAKTDVVKISRVQPDSKAWEAIAKLIPTPDLLTDEEYGARIIAVEKFLKDHPTSDKVKEAKAMLATLKAESTAVASGGVKVKGAIVSPADYQLNAYDLDARVKEAKIRTLVNQGQQLPALREFSSFCTDFQNTTSFASLAPLIVQVIKSQVAEAEQLLLTLDARSKKRMAGLDQMAAEDRKISENAIKEEDAAIEARLKLEKTGAKNWVTPSAYNKASLEETVSFGKTELTRIAAVKVALGQDAGKAWRDAFAVIRNGGSGPAIATAVSTARTAGVSPRYLAMLEEASKGRK